MTSPEIFLARADCQTTNIIDPDEIGRHGNIQSIAISQGSKIKPVQNSECIFMMLFLLLLVQNFDQSSCLHEKAKRENTEPTSHDVIVYHPDVDNDELVRNNIPGSVVPARVTDSSASSHSTLNIVHFISFCQLLLFASQNLNWSQILFQFLDCSFVQFVNYSCL